MVHGRWRGGTAATGDDETTSPGQGLLLPDGLHPVNAGARRFALEDQLRAADLKAANADTVVIRERRDPATQDSDRASLHKGLTVQQLDALATLEGFRWSLRFVRRPMFQPAIPIVFSPDNARFIVIEADGTINENPGFNIRP